MPDRYILRDAKVLANLMADLAKLPREPLMEVTVKPYRRSRSLEQNNLYWMWLGIIALETGHVMEEIHEFAKLKFLPPVFVEIGGEVRETRRSTTKLKVDEMSAYMNAVFAWAETELGIRLPLSEAA